MSWSTIAATEILEEFTPAEKAALENIQGDTAQTNLAGILTRALGLARGSIQAGGYTLGATGTIPDQLRGDVISIARWRYLVAMPQMKALQTDARKAAYEEAIKRLDKVANQELNVEAPTGDPAPASNWNSENKLIPRAHPVPRPGSQGATTSNPYANPTGPTDTEAS